MIDRVQLVFAYGFVETASKNVGKSSLVIDDGGGTGFS